MCDPMRQECIICGRQFQYGEHRYDGRFLPRYQMSVCDMCLQANHDGWAPQYEDRIIKHLKESDLEVPERNAEGWLPLE